MTDEAQVVVGGLRVPGPLLKLIREDRWVAPSDQALLASIFGEAPQHPTFYKVNGMVRENQSWHSDMDPETREWYVGSKSLESPPGDIDPARSLLIGDMGPDQPFALDYRASDSDPSVIYLRSDNGWVEIAPNIRALLSMLRLV
ncbi:SMI1/KNR4 family protein [Micromonospora carbonacea]|uniref:SMI1/KNR4 family protein n=1 Tax=Micromonospora carbonacea TaxID=47853 RepID=UPI00114CEA3D|nr:SMI1/KNR4 family protein [Micromonospora carbonacea]